MRTIRYTVSSNYRSRNSVLLGAFASSCLTVLLAIHPTSAQFVDIAAELKSTCHSQRGDKTHNFTVRCVAGTNTWHVEGNFVESANVAYWLDGTNVIVHLVITSSEYLRQIGEFASEHVLGRNPGPSSGVIHYHPKKGRSFTEVHPSPGGQPAGQGTANVAWLAFCSGPYLKQSGRQVPLPVGPSEQAWGYTDKTEVFADALGLPKHTELYSLDEQLVCDYQVIRSTNFLGWTIPLQFKLIQHGAPSNGKADFSSTTELMGKVTSISVGEEPMLPGEVQKALKK